MIRGFLVHPSRLKPKTYHGRIAKIELVDGLGPNGQDRLCITVNTWAGGPACYFEAPFHKARSYPIGRKFTFTIAAKQ